MTCLDFASRWFVRVFRKHIFEIWENKYAYPYRMWAWTLANVFFALRPYGR